MAEPNPTDSPGNNDSTSTYGNGHQVAAHIGIAGAVNTTANLEPAGRASRIIDTSPGGSGYGWISDAGMFAVNGGIRFKQCTDGLSNTFAVGE